MLPAIALNEEVVELVQDAGQRMVVYSADPDSPAGAALRLLAGITAEQARSEQARHCVAAPARAQ
jgi:hypothetical protein